MQKKRKSFYSALRASYKYEGTRLPPSLQERSMIKETSRPACRPLRTVTEGKVCDGRGPRAHRH